MNEATPLMKQYSEIKSRHSDALLLFRMGDFYELFGDDAVVAARILEIALTSRNKNDPNSPPMCGVPHHAVTHYLHKLVAAGHKVAICEQLENPAETKGIVKRDVVRVVSPGTQLDLDALDSTKPNFTHAAQVRDGMVYWSTCDYSTGHFWFGLTKTIQDWETLLRTLSPSEVILPLSGSSFRARIKEILPETYAQEVPAFYFDAAYAADRLKEQFQVHSLDAINPKLSDSSDYLGPSGALIKLYQETQKELRIPSMLRLKYWNDGHTMELDPQTVAALDLVPNDRTRGKSLFEFLNKTRTSIGARMLREWLLRPLTLVDVIQTRQERVADLRAHSENIASTLEGVYDMERLLTRVSNAAEYGTSTARDLRALAQSIAQSRDLRDQLARVSAALSRELSETLSPELLSLAEATLNALVDQPPPTTREGGMFKKGFDAELDELIDLTEKGEQWLAQYEADQRQQTGISSLKVRFNRVFGYYIEVTRTNLKNVPETYIRKQTMATAERFITSELKAFEDKILNAEKRRTDYEHALYRRQCSYFAARASEIVRTAEKVAQIDALNALALVSLYKGFTKPQVNESLELRIQDGFHPTVANAMLAHGHAFVANDVALEGARSGDPSFLLITGPNMGGKSTIMRQTALITLLAQIGSFVPAAKADVGIVDRIYTRIGSADNLAEGASTFMVEMSEMSFILNHATERSLIIVDEIGRGTSTYDGLSLATAIAEHIATQIGARTMFATHYHELTQLEGRVPGVQNARVGVKLDEAGSVEFLYKLEPGASQRSYGILVAKLAGLPEDILKRAQMVLDGHEADTPATRIRLKPQARPKNEGNQLGFQL